MGNVWGGESRIFKDETKLYPEYIPEKLPHRKNHLLELVRIFRPFITKPGSMPTRAALVGPSGTGKTVTVLKFGDILRRMVRRRQLPLDVAFVIVNCYIYKTAFAIYREIANALGVSVPRRGFSKSEVLRLIISQLENEDRYMLLAIDEADFLAKSSRDDALYDLTRLTEARMSRKPRVSLIVILRNPLSALTLDPHIRSTLAHHVIKFNPYSKKEIEDILWARVEEGAIYESAVSEEVIEAIGALVGHDMGGQGDARLALEILLNAGRIAESKGKSCIEVEDVRVAFSNVIPFPREILHHLEPHEALLLYALAMLLEERRYVNWVTTGMLERAYRELCEDLGVSARAHTMVWGYIQQLRNRGIVKTKLSTKGRGRTTQISLPGVPLGPLKEELAKVIESKLGVRVF